MQGDSSRARDSALHLVPGFCPVQPRFQLCRTGTKEWPIWVVCQAPALNHPPPRCQHSSVAARWYAMPRVAERGPPSPLAASWHMQPPPLPGQP